MELIGFKADNLKVDKGKVTLKLANKDKLGDKFFDMLEKQIKVMVPEVKSVTVAQCSFNRNNAYKNLNDI